MWDYAKLTKTAKVFGGPKAFVIKLLCAGAVGGSLITIGIVKVKNYISSYIEINKNRTKRLKE